MAARRTIVIVLAWLVTFARYATAQTPDITALRQAVVQAEGRVIVTLKTGRGAAIMAPGTPPIPAAEMNVIQGRLQASYPMQLHRQLSLIGAVVATVSDGDVARLAADTNVYMIEPDTKAYLTASISSNVPARPVRARADAIPWGVAGVGAPAAWASGLTGTGVKVGIIDTGIDYTHPDLAVAGGWDANTNTTVASAYNDTNSSCDGHGTHVAGIVAARQNGAQIVGVAPNASLYALRVFNTDAANGCYAFLSSQIGAIQWAVNNGLNVVNISIGNSPSSSMATAVFNATAAGVVVVAAAGNTGTSGILYPAAAPSAIAVAALDSPTAVAGYSTSGPEMWVAAPGSNIESTVPGGGTAFKSGTSMASPHVAGVAALLKQAHPAWSADQIRTEIKNLSVDISPSGFDNSTGWGLAQAPLGGASPLTIAVSPSARSVSVQQGTAAAGDNASVTLSGTNAGTTTWSATKRKAWTTLTTSSGTGSGSVTWTRNTTGLGVGMYVDTVTVTAAGATGSPTVVFDTLKITAAPIPVTIAVSPSARSVLAQQGTAAPGDNAAVTLTGTNAASTAWSATKKQAWLTLTSAAGTGSGTVAWNRNTTGLAVGTYVDTITVTASGATGSPAVVFDTLKITSTVAPLTLAVSPGARSVSVPQGTAAPSDYADVVLTGTNAANAVRTATHRQPWFSFSNSAGTGSGSIRWDRRTAGLAVGTYVDTVTVTVAGAVGSPAVMYDTLKITGSAVIPLTIAVSPTTRRVSVQQGLAAPGDNASVTLSGTNAGTTAWSAVKRQPWLTLSTPTGVGSSTLAWTRNATGLAVGTYVDTITVATAVTGSVVIFDTLAVVAAPIPVVMAVSPAARSVSVQQGNMAPNDSAAVSFIGTNAANTAWSATHRHGWLNFSVASGTGNAALIWVRNAAGLSVGRYVDTITVTAVGVTGSPLTVFDTLRITAPPVPIAMAVSPASRSISVPQGSTGWGDNAAVSFTGTDASAAAWSVTHSNVSWASFVNAGGTGDGFVTWNRNLASLGVGTHVDTIVVTMVGTTVSSRVYDTVRITATIALNSHGRRSRTLQFTGSSNLIAPSSDSVLVGSPSLDSTSLMTWVATTSSGRLVLGTASGTINTYVKWSRASVVLSPGMYVDTIGVSVQNDPSIRTRFVDSLEVVAVAMPTPDVAVGELFDRRSLTDDQRDTLDRQGNNNGRYDLGDFLAWVNRNHIRLSAAVSLRLRQIAPGS